MSRLWSQILGNFVIPQVPKMSHKDRKVTVVGVTRMLTQSTYMLQEPSIHAWYAIVYSLLQHLLNLLDRPATFTALVKLFSEPQYLTNNKNEEDPHAGITDIDYEEQTAGYQAAYSKLAASESVEVDPVAHIRDPQQYLGEQLVLLSKRQGQQLKAMVSAADPVTVRPFIQVLGAAGYVL